MFCACTLHTHVRSILDQIIVVFTFTNTLGFAILNNNLSFLTKSKPVFCVISWAIYALPVVVCYNTLQLILWKWDANTSALRRLQNKWTRPNLLVTRPCNCWIWLIISRFRNQWQNVVIKIQMTNMPCTDPRLWEFMSAVPFVLPQNECYFEYTAPGLTERQTRHYPTGYQASNLKGLWEIAWEKKIEVKVFTFMQSLSSY